MINANMKFYGLLAWPHTHTHKHFRKHFILTLRLNIIMLLLVQMIIIYIYQINQLNLKLFDYISMAGDFESRKVYFWIRVI